jgi:hypothetical protein
MEHELTDEEWEAPLDARLEEQIDRALAEARDFYPDEQALSVRYLPEQDLYIIVLKSGVRITIPREDLQHVADATPQEAADVVLDMLDSAVWWRTLDVAFSVKGLADGVRGNESWMKKLAERNSPAKAA